MQQLKREFWIAFAEAYPRKWLLYDTKIKDFSFKFSAEGKKAQVMIDIEPRDDEKRYAYFEKLESLRSLLEEHIPGMIYERDLTLETGKTISRVYTELSGVSLGNRNDWPRIFDFFEERMAALETFYWEYETIIKDI